jgi:hypothetical protein
VPTPILFCSDPLNARHVDEHFAGEADAVRGVGGAVALIDHDALLGGDAEAAVRRIPRDLGPARTAGPRRNIKISTDIPYSYAVVTRGGVTARFGFSSLPDHDGGPGQDP